MRTPSVYCPGLSRLLASAVLALASASCSTQTVPVGVAHPPKPVAVPLAVDEPLDARQAASKPGAALPRFTDVAATAGLTVPHYNAAHGQFRLVETMGSGVGLFDYDGDGWLDIYVAQGCDLPRDPTDRRRTAQLYRNNRDGTFTDVTAAAGVGFNGYGAGVAVGDYNGDGHDDLYISGCFGGALYRNNGDGTFTDVTEQAGVGGSGWASSCAFADLDGDGDLDLYVVHYLADTIDAQGRPTATCNATPGAIGYCPPTVFAPEPDVLYRNNGNGSFTDVSRASGIAQVAGNGLGLAIADYDEDGRLDIFVANDKTPNCLFHNLGGLRFEDVALEWGLAYNAAGETRAGMGVAHGDYDGDGRPDLLVTNFYEETNTLYRNVAPGQFQVTTAQARLALPSRSKLGFGTGFLDCDNDGRLDLFVANGHINDVRPLRMPYRMEPQLFLNLGQGQFTDVSQAAGPYFRDLWLGRGAAFGDLDNDGDTDIVVTHLERPPALLRNDTQPQGHHLSLELVGKSQSAVGARVVVQAGGRTQTRVVAAGTSYLSSHDPRVLIGVGSATRIERLEVRWLSGRTQAWTDLGADQALRINEGQEPRPQVRSARPAASEESKRLCVVESRRLRASAPAP